ncbi:HNH endonuclease [Rhizobium sp. CG4]|uniref:HNH endonuclease n=1 Tax=Rhizobium sp. CG4 TaxID=2726075 RepID=UPI002033FFB2|nr:HNH endonuclease signature motif containing protein [Rhizobium sp. CG4]MCM2455315.1 HNH endonuclease [Rhizobium sp. CG4]
MGRLTTIKPRIGTLPPRLGPATGEVERNRHRDASLEYRGWYKTARWQKLRMSVLIRDRFTCQMVGCGRVDGNTSRLVADHKTPHRGDERLFWDENNLQCLCKTCHDKLKQKEERAQSRW